MTLDNSNAVNSHSTPLEPLPTPREVANYLKKSEKTLANWRCAGIGPVSIRVGGDVRYRAHDLVEWIDANASIREVL